MVRRMMIVVLSVLMLLAVTVLLSAQSDPPMIRYTASTVMTHPSLGDMQQIMGGQAELFSTANGITVNFRTDGLEEGHVYTAWIAILNNPENCATSPCTGADILGKTDITKTEVTFGDGIVVGPDHRMTFAAYLPAGDVPEPWFGNGISNPLGAEIQVIINDHGPLIPELASSMLNSYRGGCSDESLPPPFPDTAKADGEAGPNTCRLIQVAVFQQR